MAEATGSPAPVLIPGLLWEVAEVGQFQPGQSGNPKGRPKGSGCGRTAALAVLDRFLAKPRTQEALGKAFAKELKARPMTFFRTVVMPLLPKEAKVELGREGLIQWKGLLGGGESGTDS